MSSSPLDAASAEEAAYLGQLDSVLRRLASAPAEPIAESIRGASVKPFLDGSWFRSWLELLKKTILDHVTTLWRRGMDSGAAVLPPHIALDLQRDIVAIVEANAPLQAADSLKDVSSKTRAGIRRLIRRASGHYLRNPSPEKLARLTLQVKRRIGITAKQLRRIEAFELKAKAAGLSDRAIEQEVLLRVERARAIRARAIVSNGTAQAINGGRHEAWKKAIAKGLLPAVTMKRSRDQGDGRVRSLHHAQSLEAPIPIESNYRYFAVKHPPFERSCRCWDEIVAPGIRPAVLTAQPSPVILPSGG